MDEEIREEHELIENMQKDLDETYLDVLLKRLEEDLKDLLKRLLHSSMVIKHPRKRRYPWQERRPGS